MTCALGTIANGGERERRGEGAPAGRRPDHQPGDGRLRPSTTRSPGNNSASATTTVTPVADLSLTKSDSPDPVLAGELLTYTLGVHNAGPSSADRA